MSISKKFPSSGIKSDFSTGIVYVGPPKEWIQSDFMQLETDEFGVNTLRREFNLRRDVELPKFLPTRGDFDPQYPGLEVFDYNVTAKGPFQKLTVRYNGFITKPRAPIVKTTNDVQVRQQIVYSLQNAGELQRIGIIGGLTFRYLAPTLNKRYATPQRPKFRTPYEDPTFKEPIQILGIFTEAGVQLDLLNFQSVLKFFDIRNQQKSVRVTTQSELVGNVYYNTEIIERQIIQQEIFDLGAFV